jgi:hypothetical protein
VSWPASEPAIHLADCTMDGAHTLALCAKPGHDKLKLER